MTIPEWVLMAWKERVYDRTEETDPINEQDWYSLALGFALGLGFKPNEAHVIANHIRSSGMG